MAVENDGRGRKRDRIERTHGRGFRGGRGSIEKSIVSFGGKEEREDRRKANWCQKMRRKPERKRAREIFMFNITYLETTSLCSEMRSVMAGGNKQLHGALGSTLLVHRRSQGSRRLSNASRPAQSPERAVTNHLNRRGTGGEKSCGGYSIGGAGKSGGRRLFGAPPESLLREGMGPGVKGGAD